MHNFLRQKKLAGTSGLQHQHFGRDRWLVFLCLDGKNPWLSDFLCLMQVQKRFTIYYSLLRIISVFRSANARTCIANMIVEGASRCDILVLFLVLISPSFGFVILYTVYLFPLFLLIFFIYFVDYPGYVVFQICHFIQLVLKQITVFDNIEMLIIRYLNVFISRNKYM